MGKHDDISPDSVPVFDPPGLQQSEVSENQKPPGSIETRPHQQGTQDR